MRLTIPLLATFAAVLLVPAAAQAGTLSYDGDTLYFQAAGGERNSPFFDKTDDGRLSIVETGLTIAAGCEQEFSWGPAYCPMPSRIVMHLEDGDDGVGFASTFPAIAVEVYGGDGKDQLKGYGATNALLDGGPGFDLIDDYSIPSDDYHPPVSLTMDGVANDGRPGESDNVMNIEKVESHVSGTLAGGDGDDDFRIFANIDEGNSVMAGNGGNDKLIAGD